MTLEVKSDKIDIPHSVWKLIPKFIRSFRSLSLTNQEDVFQSYSFLGQSRFCPPSLLLEEMFAAGMWAPEYSSNRDFEDVNPSFKMLKCSEKNGNWNAYKGKSCDMFKSSGIAAEWILWWEMVLFNCCFQNEQFFIIFIFSVKQSHWKLFMIMPVSSYNLGELTVKVTKSFYGSADKHKQWPLHWS